MKNHKIATVHSLALAGFLPHEIESLFRIERTLHRWHELECGTDAGHIERGESRAVCTQCGHKWTGETALTHNCPACGDCAPLRTRDDGKPRFYNARARYVDPHDPRAWNVIPDLEAGAQKRLAAIMASHPDCAACVQGDPRGCALYILRPGDVPAGKSPSAYYNRGIAVCS